MKKFDDMLKIYVQDLVEYDVLRYEWVSPVFMWYNWAGSHDKPPELLAKPVGVVLDLCQAACMEGCKHLTQSQVHQLLTDEKGVEVPDGLSELGSAKALSAACFPEMSELQLLMLLLERIAEMMGVDEEFLDDLMVLNETMPMMNKDACADFKTEATAIEHKREKKQRFQAEWQQMRRALRAEEDKKAKKDKKGKKAKKGDKDTDIVFL